MTTADFIVVGGGIYGAATSYYLSKAGADVLLLEQDELAVGASGGIGKRGIRVNKRDPREIPLVAEAYELWPYLAEEIGGETGYVNTGGVYLIESDMAGLSGGHIASYERARLQESLGAPTEVWKREKLIDVLPDLAEGITGALYAPKDSVASQTSTTMSYGKSAEAAGAMILTHTSVDALLREDSGRIVGVTTDTGQEYRARKSVLLANNAGAVSLLRRSLDIRLPVWGVYPQALVLTAENKPVMPLLIGHDSRKISVKEMGTRSIQLTGGWRGKFNASTGQAELDKDQVNGNIAELRAVFPNLGELTLEAGYVDRCEAISIDEIPLIGEICSGLQIALGWSAHGWALAPSVSRRLAQSLLQRSEDRLLAPFSPLRFPALRLA